MTNDYGLRSSKPRLKALGFGYLAFALLLTLACLSLATQETAAYFSYAPELGHPWGGAWGRVWYAPWKIITWSTWWEHEAIHRAVSHGQMLFVFPQILAFGYIIATARKLKGRSDLHGSAHWATEDEIRETGLLGGKGVYIGSWVKRCTGWEAFWRMLNGRQIESQLFLRHDGPEHILGYAPTGSGKGVGFIRPTLVSYPDSAVVLDIKGENWAYSSGWRKSQGHKTFRFDPSDPSGKSACINVLEEVRLSTLSAIPDVQNIATMIVDPEGKGLQDHWSKAGFAFIAGALLHCLVMVRHSQKRTAALHDLGNMLADKSKTIEQLFQEMLTTEHAKLVAECFPSGATGGEQIHTFIASSAREMLNKAANESSGVVSTALVNLALYRDPVVALNTSRSDFKIHDLMNSETPVTLYLVISPADINRLRPLLRLILNLIISRI
ncbi:MAG: type IV secretory system conjugative DNA transfer family protein, partial [Desulfovibrionaceae bacterium]|nr:type IV secretory system conjugative DNA transfer family protein [Desulfovibrionaceae bacterium]